MSLEMMSKLRVMGGCKELIFFYLENLYSKHQVSGQYKLEEKGQVSNSQTS